MAFCGVSGLIPWANPFPRPVTSFGREYFSTKKQRASADSFTIGVPRREPGYHNKAREAPCFCYREFVTHAADMADVDTETEPIPKFPSPAGLVPLSTSSFPPPGEDGQQRQGNRRQH